MKAFLNAQRTRGQYYQRVWQSWLTQGWAMGFVSLNHRMIFDGKGEIRTHQLKEDAVVDSTKLFQARHNTDWQIDKSGRARDTDTKAWRSHITTIIHPVWFTSLFYRSQSMAIRKKVSGQVGNPMFSCSTLKSISRKCLYLFKVNWMPWLSHYKDTKEILCNRLRRSWRVSIPKFYQL